MIQVKGTFNLLATAYLSNQDDVKTTPSSALKRYPKYNTTSHEAIEYLGITTPKKNTTLTNTITVAGLDYVKFKLHHLKRSMKTKPERNPHLSAKPKFIFHAGQYPTQSTTVKKKCKEIMDLPTRVPNGTPGNASRRTTPQISPTLPTILSN